MVVKRLLESFIPELYLYLNIYKIIIHFVQSDYSNIQIIRIILTIEQT